ncbi:RIP metalloprotease RseP [Roseateles sp.]|uniref:RIP metalloprotease RseP n=1 Tax=Roseateles sp. TaxID=1971397 RepID=UPI003BA40EE5
MTTLLAFLLTLGVLVAVHEYGHYRVARACGVKVLRFSVGFGKVIWRRQSSPDATEFTLCVLPLGGYVRMLDEREGPVAPDLRDQAFNNRPLRQRAAIVAAGPLANFLLAVVLFAAVFWVGTEEPQPVLGTPAAESLAARAGLQSGDRVRATSPDGQNWRELNSYPELLSRTTEAMAQGERLHLDVSGHGSQGHRSLLLETDRLAQHEFDAATLRKLGLSPLAEPVLGKVTPGGAADAAGLQAGDRVLAVQGMPILDAAGLRDWIRNSVREGQSQTAVWKVERAGRVLELEVSPKVAQDNGRAIGRIEAMVGAAPATVKVSRGFFDGLFGGVQRTWDVSSMTLKVFGRMLVGEASLKNLSGPLTIADYAGQSARSGLAQYLGFLALVSVSLGVLNLLPLPMLDGGHLMYYLFEVLSGRPVSEWWQTQLQRAGALILMLMMVLALSNDVARLTGLH